MPDFDELRKAQADERADGFGVLPGKPDGYAVETPGAPACEVSLLESGQTLYHHTKLDCVGDCCLHGTSRYTSCRMPRSWRVDRRILEHHCRHGVGHPCYAGLAPYDGVHGCDGCCVEEAPHDPEVTKLLLRVLAMDTRVDVLAERVDFLSDTAKWHGEDLRNLEARFRTYRLVALLPSFALLLFVAASIVFGW